MQPEQQPAPSGAAEDTGISLDFGALADGLGLLMKISQIRAAELSARHFREANLAPSSYTILKLLQANPGLRQGHLAQALRIKPALMTKLVRDFEDLGWIRRTIPDDDRRTVILRLTVAGEDRVRLARVHVQNAMQAERGPLTEEEVQTLRQLLQRYIGFAPGPVLRLPGPGETSEEDKT